LSVCNTSRKECLKIGNLKAGELGTVTKNTSTFPILTLSGMVAAEEMRKGTE
jgi:hypothetical protein